ncbi:MAG: transglutaminase family protein [Rhodospirillales bacterium]
MPRPAPLPEQAPEPRDIVRTALCVEAREGRLHVFLPPLTRIEDFIELVAAIERAAAATGLPLWLEGYAPPRDVRLGQFSVTPDPAVIEVNIHPAASWDELVERTTVIYEEARLTRLGTEKFMLDGRHTGTGGGNHITLGGATAADSPILRRPDLLASLIAYWQNHPALSVPVFRHVHRSHQPGAAGGRGARRQPVRTRDRAPATFKRVAAGRRKRQALAGRPFAAQPVDGSHRNTHRAEFSIDKLYSPDSATGRLGLVELRAFEMPPHPHMSLAQVLLLRTLVACFWRAPYTRPLIAWGTELHDRFMLPHFVEADMRDVVRDLAHAGYAFDAAWLAPFLEFRFPRYGSVVYDNVQIEFKRAIEPWNVLGEEVAQGGTARYVDSSVERLQVKVNGITGSRHVVTCNGRPLPLHPTGVHGEYVAGVRYKAWSPPSALHPTIGVHSPLVFDLVDTWNARSLGGCTYHVSHPGGRSYDTFPVNANEAEARRIARFRDHGHTPGRMDVKAEPLNPQFPYTLDLRRG